MTTVLLTGGGTGGHLMPLLAIADRLRQEHPDWRIVIAGAERGVEAKILPGREYPFQLLPSEPIYRRAWWRNARWPLLLIPLLRRVGRMLESERPSLVFGTGGYAAGPVLWAASRRGITTAIWDGDAVPGLASRWAARQAREIFVSYPEARARLAPHLAERVTVTGAPIVAPDPELRAEGRTRYGIEPGRSVVLVTGGGQGSLAINRAVSAWLAGGGGGERHVLWATGHASYPEFSSHHHPPHVHVTPFLDPIGPAYAVADLAVVRGGTMSLSELCAWGIPGVVVPLPSAAANHQVRNAEALAAVGAVDVLPQERLSAQSLGSAVEGLLSDPARRGAMRAAGLARAKPRATQEIAARVGRLILDG